MRANSANSTDRMNYRAKANATYNSAWSGSGVHMKHEKFEVSQNCSEHYTPAHKSFKWLSLNGDTDDGHNRIE